MFPLNFYVQTRVTNQYDIKNNDTQSFDVILFKQPQDT